MIRYALLSFFAGLSLWATTPSIYDIVGNQLFNRPASSTSNTAPQAGSLLETTNTTRIEQLCVKEFSTYAHLQKHNGVLPYESIQELSILNKQGLVAALDKTQTTHGRLVFARLISDPTADHREIMARQQAVSLLANDHVVRQTLISIFNEFKKAESQFWTLFDEEQAIPESLKKYAFLTTFLGKDLRAYNTSPLAQKIGLYTSDFFRYGSLAALPLGLAWFRRLSNKSFTPTAFSNDVQSWSNDIKKIITYTPPSRDIFNDIGEEIIPTGVLSPMDENSFKFHYNILKDELKKQGYGNKTEQLKINFLRVLYPIKKLEDNIRTTASCPPFADKSQEARVVWASEVKKLAEDYLAIDENKNKKIDTSKFESVLKRFKENFTKELDHSQLKHNYQIIGIIGAILAYTQGSLIKSDRERAEITETLFKDMNVRIKSVAMFHKKLTELCAIAEKYPYLKPVCAIGETLSAFLQNNKLKRLSSLLEKETLSTTDLSTAYSLFDEVKREYIPALEAAGCIEALITAAEQCAENTMVTVTIRDDEKPYINFVDIKNPRIRHAITNSITFGTTKENANSLITGPNGSGKSALGEAVVYALILGQSLAISPAAFAEQTIFQHIATYNNIHGNIAKGQSQFMAEKARMDSIAQKITHNSLHEKIFVYIDEPFSGTTPQEGDSRVGLFSRLVAQDPYTMALIITHFSESPDTAAQTGAFTNYHMKIEDKGTSFTNLYQLEFGKDPLWFNPITRKRYIDQLITKND